MYVEIERDVGAGCRKKKEQKEFQNRRDDSI